MKLTEAERRVLHSLDVRAWSERTSREVIGIRRDLERRMISRGLLSKRAQSRNCIAATAAGRAAFLAIQGEE